MEKVYKHKKTGYIATQLEKDSVVYKYDCGLPLSCYIKQEILEDSCDWEKIIHKDYEILSFRSHRNRFYNPTIQKDGTYLDAEIMEFDGNGASLEWMLNENEYYITSVKRLSDGEVFAVGGKAQTIGSYPHTITSIEVRQKSLRKEGGEWLKDGIDRIWFNWELGRGGNWLDAIEKVKEPILTTFDGVDIFEGDTHYYIWLKEPVLEQEVNKIYKKVTKSLHGDEKWLKDMVTFSTKESAEKHLKENQKKYSVNDIKEIVKKLGCFGTTLIEYLENENR